MRRVVMAPRIRCLLVGVIAGLASVLCLDDVTLPVGVTGLPSAAWTITHMLIALASAAVAMLATAAGGLIASDWQADVQIREAWAQIGPALIETCLPVDFEPTRDIDADTAMVRQILRAHRFARPLAEDHATDVVASVVGVRRTGLALTERIGTQSPRHTSPTFVGDQECATGKPSEAQPFGRALAQVVDTRAPRASKVVRTAKFRMMRVAATPRLVANSRSWCPWPEDDPRVSTSTGSIIVLSRRQEENAQSPPDASVGSDDPMRAARPSCRGPPSGKPRRLALRAETTGVRTTPTSQAVSEGNPAVLDDLGTPVPVRATEMAVIETYLGDVLDELFASAKASSEPEQT